MVSAGRRRVALNVGIALLVGVAFVGVQRFLDEPVDNAPAVAAEPAPDFRLPMVVKGKWPGEETSLAAYRGKPVVVNFWATWCGICTEEKPQLQRLSASLAGTPMLGIASWDKEEAVSAAEADDPSGYPIALDQVGSVADKFGIDGLPVTLVIDSQGRILRRFSGALTELDVKAIEHLVAQDASASH